MQTELNIIDWDRLLALFNVRTKKILVPILTDRRTEFGHPIYNIQVGDTVSNIPFIRLTFEHAVDRGNCIPIYDEKDLLVYQIKYGS
jgi:hypothetical protein